MNSTENSIFLHVDRHIMEQKHLSIKDAAGLKSRSWDYSVIRPVIVKVLVSGLCVDTMAI